MPFRCPGLATRHIPLRWGIGALCAALTISAAACGDDSTTPASGGTYTAMLEGPDGHMNGAALISLTGTGIDSVTSRYGRIFTEREGDAIRVILVAETPGNLNFVVHMRDGSDLPAASILEVSDENDDLRPLQGYTLRFRQ